MALDPLKFAVQITDEATQELKNIKTLIDGLQDKSVNISVSGNLGELLTFLKDGVDASKFDNLKSSINEALSGLDGLNRAAKEGNFAEYAGQINTAKDAVTALANAIAAVDAVVGTNEGFQKFMVSIGEVVTRVDAALKQLNESSNANGGVMGSKSIEKAKYELYQFDNLVKQAEQTSRLGKQFGDVDTTGLDKAIEKLKTYRAELDQISQTGKGQNGRGFEKFALQAEYKEAVDQVKKLSAEQHSTEMNLGRYNAMLKETDALWDRILAAWTKGSNIGVATANMQPAENQARDFYQRLKSLNEADLNNVQIISQLAAEFQRLKSTLTATAKEQEKLNAATEKQRAKDQADATKKTQRENEAWAKSMRDASAEANKLGIELNRLRKIEQAGSDVGADTTKLKQYISTLETYKIVLDQIAAGNRTLGHASDWISGKSTISGYDTLGNTGRLAKEAAGAVRELTAEKQRSASATSQLTNEEQRLAQALNQTAESAKGQSQVLSDLKSMAMQYLGVWGGQQFLHNIIEIGGQLEMQRMSIGAILQNQSQANDLFEKIKGLAVQSPFGVVELDQMTKQLTAYGFKYSELFDMTKRLADISAATGTGVDRLALALGHVRSEAALSGYTLRQFSMGNVPLLAKLSEKLGKTTQEIRKMVRAKEISYEDVEGVIKDLTNEGGMFYNMQETISQSVKARFKNVKDAMAIMYGEMAESGMGDALKSVADNLMTITKNWKDVATVMGAGAAVWAVQRAAIMAYTAMIGKSTAATFASIGANVKKQGVMLQLANKYRVLTTAERDLLNASRANSVMIKLRTMLGMNYTKAQGVYIAAQRTIITNTLTQSLSEGKLTVAELAHMVATRKLSHEEARLIITNSSLNHSEQVRAISTINTTRQLSKLELAYRRVGMAMKSLGSMALSFLPMAAITGLIELWQRNNQELERAEDLYKSIFEASQEGLKNARTMMKETDIGAMQFRDKKLIDVTSSFGVEDESRAKTFYVKPEFDESTAEQVIERWSQFIRDYAGTPNQILNNALKDSSENVRMLKDQFDTLYDSVTQVIDGYKEMADLAWVFAAAQDETGSGAFNEDIVKNIQDYEASLKNFNRSLVKYFKESGRSIQRGIDAARASDKGFADATEGMTSYIDMLKKLTESSEEYSDAVDAFKSKGGRSIWYNILDDSELVDKAHTIMENDLNQYINGIQAAFRAAGKNPRNLDESTQQGLMSVFTKQFIGSLGNISDETRNELIEKFAKAFNMSVDAAEEITVKRLRDWQKRAEEAFEVNTTIKVKAKAESDINEFAKLVQKDLKEKQDYITNMQSHIREIVIKMPINVQPALKFTTESIGKVIASLTDKIMQMPKGELKNQLWSQLFDELIPFYDALRAMEEDKKWLKQEGFPEKDPTKDKSKNKNKSEKRYKDPDVERWKERMKNLKAAYDEYEKLENEFGHDEAILRVKRAFNGLIDEKDIDNIKEYRKELVEIKNKALDRFASQKGDKSKDYGKQAQQLAREAEKAINDIDLGEQKRRSDEYLSKLKLQLDELKKQWETFNKVRMATGNEEIAAKVAGLSQDQASKRDIANSVKANIQGIIKEMGGEVKVPIKFDVTSSDKDIENNVKAALGGSEKYREQIKGITEAIKTWRDLERDAMQKSVDAYTQAVSKAMDYESQLARINAELAEQNRLVDQNNKLSQEQKDRAKGINQANASMKALEASDSYKRFFNGIFGETKTELLGMANIIKSELNYSLKNGAITAEEYAKRIKDIDDVMKQSEISDPDKWYNKGIFNTETMDQRYQRKYGEGNEMNQEGADMFQKGIESGDEAMQKAGQEMMENGQNMMKGAKNAAITMAIIDKVIHGIDQSIQGTVKAFDYLKEALDSLGVESDTMSSVGDYLHTLGEMSSHVTQSWDNFKSGNFVGAGVEAIGAVTSVIKGISQAHDNRLERAITKLREDVKAIEANTELIARSRERTLGYDMGDVRRAMVQQYSPQSWRNQDGTIDLTRLLTGGFNSKQQRSMFEYYSQNSFGTGYQQEYNNLLEQREKYLEILKDQQDKKKKSNDEIEETKSKIAELDDQIAYFAQDLAKELWSIDIKGWADQLSDALASAFENGENMAKAYRDTVTSIIQQMMQKMMQMAILEPMFERLQKQLFGENGKGGVFDPNNPKGSMSKITAMIGDFFGKGGEGEKAITASMEFMTAFQRGMQNAGLTVLNEASNTLSNSMQGTTEETSGLLAGYVNALRQDVSVNRILLTQFVSQMWPDYIETFASQVTAVQNIDTNVQVIMTMMQMGNGAMYDEIAAMRARIDNVVMGIDRFAVK